MKVKKLLVVVVVIAAVALPLFAQSVVEKKSLSFNGASQNFFQLTGSIDFDWQTQNSVQSRGAGFRIGADCYLKNGVDLGLDLSLVTMTDRDINKGPGLFRAVHAVGYHFNLGHEAIMRLKAGVGAELRLHEGKADFRLTTQAGTAVYLRMTDAIAMEFGCTGYVTFPKSGETGVAITVSPGFGLSFTL